MTGFAVLEDLPLPDGSVTPVRLFTGRVGAPIIVIWPGLGMGARYYEPIAALLAERGFNVAIGELHGQGGNSATAARGHVFGYHEQVTRDFPATIALARRQLGVDERATSPARLPVYLLGHSMGGQMSSLYAARPGADVEALILLGAGTPHHRVFHGASSRRLRYGAPVMSGISRFRGYWPGGRLDIAGYGRQPARLIRDWARFSRTGRILPTDADIDYEAAMRSVTLPILSVVLGADADCPEGSARDLLAKMPNARATVEFEPRPLGHNRWAREPVSTVDRIEAWLAREGLPGASAGD